MKGGNRWRIIFLETNRRVFLSRVLLVCSFWPRREVFLPEVSRLTCITYTHICIIQVITLALSSFPGSRKFTIIIVLARMTHTHTHTHTTLQSQWQQVRTRTTRTHTLFKYTTSVYTDSVGLLTHTHTHPYIIGTSSTLCTHTHTHTQMYII